MRRAVFSSDSAHATDHGVNKEPTWEIDGISESLMARCWAWHAVASGVLVSCGYVAGVVVQYVGARIIALTGRTIQLASR